MTNRTSKHIPFMKMHGLGNDFVVVDTRAGDVPLNGTLIRALADRRRGVGFDQLAVISEGTDLTLTFYNADGSTSAACGNATRCVAAYEMEKTGQIALEITVQGRGTLHARKGADGMIAVNMGAPELFWQAIPLAREVDTLHLPLDGDPVATGMGNPHCTFFMTDVDAVDLEKVGPVIENDALFPERTNVQFVQVLGRDHVRMRVWERGAGITPASGSSSCAVTVAAVRRGLTDRAVRVDLDGGTLNIDWREDGVWMGGPTEHVFDGVLTANYLESL